MTIDSLILPIRFDKPVDFRSISEEAKIFLQELGELFVGSELFGSCELANVYPINDPHVFPPSSLVHDVANSELFDQNLKVLILDVGGPNDSDRLLHPQFILGITTVISSIEQRFKKLQIIITLPRELDINDSFDAGLEGVLKGDRISYFYYQSRKYKSTNFSSKEIELKIDAIHKLLDKAVFDPEKILKRKIICHRGKYEIPQKNKIIFNYYDGNFAHSEIQKIVTHIVDNMIAATSGKKLRVLIDDRGSSWFFEATRNLWNYNFHDTVGADYCSSLEEEEAEKQYDIIFFPLCRTGDTAKEILEKISYGTPNCGNPDVFILVDVGELDNENTKERVINLKTGFTVNANIITKLPERHSSLEQLWDGSSFPALPIDQINLNSKFSADSMWAMVFDAGIKEETDLPNGRASLGWVPKFEALIEQNGPLLAYNIARVLNNNISGDYAILHPDEDAANKLADCILDFAVKGTIPINKELIDLAEHTNTEKALLKRAEDKGVPIVETIKSLRDQTKNATRGSHEPLKVIILTEFIASHSTINGLKNISTIMGWHFLGSTISLANMYEPDSQSLINDNFFYQFGYEK